MPPALYDAHCHWQDERLAPHREAIADALRQSGLRRAVVNGTHPQDWGAVAALAKQDARVLPAFGLHPWHVNAVCKTEQCIGGSEAPCRSEIRAPRSAPPDQAPPNQTASFLSTADTIEGKAADWLQTLEAFLKAHPRAAVGEIGLDNWIEGADIGLQTEVFLTQMALAARDNRPVSIHCLRADADLLRALKTTTALPARGIHLHGFAGSAETARQLLDYGAYFSFSEYIAEPKRTKARTVAAMVPLERLLAETDAPDMTGPPQWQHYRLENGEHPAAQMPPKHPANISASYACLAQLRGLALEELAAAIENNFVRYFEV